jgi:hypothetical protein
MTTDFVAITNQCKKGFGKERGQEIGEKIRWIDNRLFFAARGFYVYALFDIGRKTRKEDAVTDMKEANQALRDIIKTAKELQAEIRAELKRIEEV